MARPGSRSVVNLFVTVGAAISACLLLLRRVILQYSRDARYQRQWLGIGAALVTVYLWCLGVLYFVAFILGSPQHAVLVWINYSMVLLVNAALPNMMLGFGVFLLLMAAEDAVSGLGVQLARLRWISHTLRGLLQPRRDGSEGRDVTWNGLFEVLRQALDMAVPVVCFLAMGAGLLLVLVWMLRCESPSTGLSIWELDQAAAFAGGAVVAAVNAWPLFRNVISHIRKGVRAGSSDRSPSSSSWEFILEWARCNGLTS